MRLTSITSPTCTSTSGRGESSPLRSVVVTKFLNMFRLFSSDFVGRGTWWIDRSTCTCIICVAERATVFQVHGRVWGVLNFFYCALEF